jgi:hypothetical protein
MGVFSYQLVLMSKPQNLSVPGWPTQGVHPGRVEPVGAREVEQVVAVEFAEMLELTLELAEDVMLADVVIVESVDEEVIETELLELVEEATDEELEDVVQPLIFLAPQTPALAFAAPTEDLR